MWGPTIVQGLPNLLLSQAGALGAQESQGGPTSEQVPCRRTLLQQGLVRGGDEGLELFGPRDILAHLQVGGQGAEKVTPVFLTGWPRRELRGPCPGRELREAKPSIHLCLDGLLPLDVYFICREV